jgi:hypothetical protein
MRSDLPPTFPALEWPTLGEAKSLLQSDFRPSALNLYFARLIHASHYEAFFAKRPPLAWISTANN